MNSQRAVRIEELSDPEKKVELLDYLGCALYWVLVDGMATAMDKWEYLGLDLQQQARLERNMRQAFANGLGIPENHLSGMNLDIQNARETCFGMSILLT